MKPKRFHVYVANRIQQICDLTDPKSWFYIDTSSNPLDDTSRGLTTKQLSEDSQCLTSPELLWKKGSCKPEIVGVSPSRVRPGSEKRVHIDHGSQECCSVS